MPEENQLLIYQAVIKTQSSPTLLLKVCAKEYQSQWELDRNAYHLVPSHIC